MTKWLVPIGSGHAHVVTLANLHPTTCILLGYFDNSIFHQPLYENLHHAYVHLYEQQTLR